jgi:hypothetical protein
VATVDLAFILPNEQESKNDVQKNRGGGSGDKGDNMLKLVVA